MAPCGTPWGNRSLQGTLLALSLLLPSEERTFNQTMIDVACMFAFYGNNFRTLATVSQCATHAALHEHLLARQIYL